MEKTTEFLNYAAINLDAVGHNIRQIKQLVGKNVEIFAVVKANAYGHGALQVSRAALENGASRLAVNRVIEGVELRKGQISAPVLIMGYSPAYEAKMIVENNLTASVQNIETVKALSYHASQLNKTARIHLKIDTGMGRYGLMPDEVVKFLVSISKLPALEIEGIFTHFSSASEQDKTYSRRQFTIFLDVIEKARKAGFEFNIHHAANSASTLDMPEVHLDAVRPGIAIYGLNPYDDKKPPIPLSPALKLISHVARIKLLPSGSSISYGRTYTTYRKTSVALIPIGYGDGYHRILSNKGKVLIRGKSASILGRVCMDQFVVDISDIEGVSQDDEVVLIGEQSGKNISAEELAVLADTINYEITTGILPRIPRVYLSEGKLVETRSLTSTV